MKAEVRSLRRCFVRKQTILAMMAANERTYSHAVTNPSADDDIILVLVSCLSRTALPRDKILTMPLLCGMSIHTSIKVSHFVTILLQA